MTHDNNLGFFFIVSIYVSSVSFDGYARGK